MRLVELFPDAFYVTFLQKNWGARNKSLACFDTISHLTQSLVRFVTIYEDFAYLMRIENKKTVALKQLPKPLKSKKLINKTKNKINKQIDMQMPFHTFYLIKIL